MTIEEAREYWSRRLERASGYSDEHWDAEERHTHKEYIDALKHAITALAIYREREEAAKKSKTNGDRIRQMTDDEKLLSAIGTGCYRCAYRNGECDSGYGEGCIAGNLEWLRNEADEDAGSKTD